MKNILWFLITISTAISGFSRDVIILDNNDKAPVIGASVISANGMIIGISDKKRSNRSKSTRLSIVNQMHGL